MMFSLLGRPAQLCDRISRREVVRIGGLSTLGLSLPQLLQAQEAVQTARSDQPMFGRAKNVIYLYLQGGPPQHETFDPKPHAPVEIRGPFQPIQTNIPGIQFCELLPRTARMADKLAVVRSMSTDDNIHSSSGYEVLTGHKYRGPNARTIQPTDWPYFGSIVKMLKPSQLLPPLTAVWIPDLMRLNDSVTPAGQTAGFLGSRWHPIRFLGDPSHRDYKVQGLHLTDFSPEQLSRRASLLRQLEQTFDITQRSEAAQAYEAFQQQAFDLLISGRARRAFRIQEEPPEVRDRYGRSQWGQCVLLARRLIEAGVRLVHVNWPREPGDSAVDNPLWDTHAQNADRLEDVLCPQFDVGFSALIEDLEQRGLLEETLVVAIGEFGRTPKINSKGGRDHWGPVFSFALAGAGIRGGQVIGASDEHGAYPARDRVEPKDLTATLFHLLGIPYQGTFSDREGRARRLTEGELIYPLLGDNSATSARTDPGGSVARVPPYNPSPLLNSDFSQPAPLYPVQGPSRPKGWRAAPLLANENDTQFGVRFLQSAGNSAKGSRRHVALGFGFGGRLSPITIPHGAQAILAQEVRSPFAGTFLLALQACGDGTSQSVYETIFLRNFTCRLIFYQYTHPEKRPDQRRELASVTIEPEFRESGATDGFQSFRLVKQFVNPNPGQNFSFGLGLGVALIVEKTSPGVLRLPAGHEPSEAFLRIAEMRLDFQGKQRNEDVKV